MVADHVQSQKDWNTWDYKNRYGRLVRCGHYTVGCGDCIAYLDFTQGMLWVDHV